jgi:hypothetical protein
VFNYITQNILLQFVLPLNLNILKNIVALCQIFGQRFAVLDFVCALNVFCPYNFDDDFLRAKSLIGGFLL